MSASISRCTAADIADVAQFIDQHWKRGHILSTCRALLDWQHQDLDGDGYSFVLARRRADAAVLGVLGYLPTRRFDPALAHDCVLWLTIWKVRDDAGIPGLGFAMLQFLIKSEPHVAVGALGLNPSTLPIYRALGYRTGDLAHYVRPNARVNAFHIATLHATAAPPSPVAGPPLQMKHLTRDEDFHAFASLPVAERTPAKTAAYVRGRYARHPIYRYELVGLFDGALPVGIIVARIAEYEDRRALRIIDFLGADAVWARVGPVVQTLVEEARAEYADVYNTGIAAAFFEQAGFRRIDPDGPDIVPDHFEPFARRNVRLWFALGGSAPAIVFKGDADQDRPNRVTVSPA